MTQTLLPEAALTPEQLKAWRIRRGLTQAKLARLLDVSWRTIARWEAGGPSRVGKPDVEIPHVVDLALRELGRRRSLHIEEGED